MKKLHFRAKEAIFAHFIQFGAKKWIIFYPHTAQGYHIAHLITAE